MIKCIAVDDEPLALNQIARFIGRIPELQLIGTCLTVGQAQELLEKEPIDLVFLDIEMPGCDGVTFAKLLKEKNAVSSIIFTTAYPQYAVDGFRVDAVDYLLKPLSFEEMQEAVERVKRRMALVEKDIPETTSQTIFVKVAGSVRQIPIADIVYVQGLGAYVQLCVKGEPKLLTTHESLKHLEELLPTDCFLRIHKSYIININYLEGAGNDVANLNGKSLPIGHKYRAALKEFFKQKLL